MKKASEYRQHAKECRQLAGGMDSNEQRDLMLEMAQHWDKLALDRQALIEKHPELAHEGEHDEEATLGGGKVPGPVEGKPQRG